MNIRRRDLFKTAAVLVAGVQPSGTFAKDETVGETWRGWRKGEFQVHFIYTGVAESMFFIFPDSTTMLLDCGDHAAVTRLELAVPVLPNSGRLAGDWIARYVRRVNPNFDRVDYMMTSHLHQDHVGTPCWQSRRVLKRGERNTGCYRSGFGLALEQLHFGKAIDRGWPDYNDPVPYVDSEWKPLEHMKRVYKYLAERDGLIIEKFRLGVEDQIVPVRDADSVRGFTVRNIAANGRLAMPDGTIRDTLCRNGRFPDYFNENIFSLGMVFSCGAFKFYTAGDFSGPAKFNGEKPFFPETEIGKAAGKVDVAKINHHGFHSMPIETVRDLSARVYVACVWDQLHVTDDTMKRLSDRGIYPGERTICPGVLSVERRRSEGDRPWMKDVPTALYEGSHIVLTVPPGGSEYSMTFIGAEDESMKVKDVLHFKSNFA